MQSVTIKDNNSGAHAKIATGLGFNCYEFQVPHPDGPLDVLYADEGFPSADVPPTRSGIPILFPFPNRICEGKFQWDGVDYELTKDRVGYDPAGTNAIHGFALDRPWRVLEQGENFVLGEFRLSKDAPERRDLWPTDCVLRVRYEVKGTSLRAGIEVVNPDETPMPWGLGTHPYFRVPFVPAANGDRCLVTVPARQRWKLVDCLPTGEREALPADKNMCDGQEFGGLQLDDVYTDVVPESQAVRCSLMDAAAGLEVVQTCDPAFRELVVFTPPTRKAVCMEPYTCNTDAVNLEARDIDAGWRTLGPHQSYKTWIEISAGPVLA